MQIKEPQKMTVPNPDLGSKSAKSNPDQGPQAAKEAKVAAASEEVAEQPEADSVRQHSETEAATVAEQPEAEAHTAQLWHSAMLTGLVFFCGLYLAAALIPLPRALVLIGAVGAFAFALGYMGTMIWVYSLRTERKRAAKKK